MNRTIYEATQAEQEKILCPILREWDRAARFRLIEYLGRTLDRGIPNIPDEQLAAAIDAKRKGNEAPEYLTVAHPGFHREAQSVSNRFLKGLVAALLLTMFAGAIVASVLIRVGVWG